MPHLIVEAHDAPDDLLVHLNQVLIDSGVFNAKDIKARLIVPQQSLLATGGVGAFITLKLMKGREKSVRETLASALLSALKNKIKADEYCVEVVELSDVYQKC